MNATTDVNPVPRSQPPLSGQIAVIQEMLSSLDTLTAAGQHHVMSKVVGFIEHQVASVLRFASPRHGRVLLEQLAHLERETARLLPDTQGFSDRAASLVALLGALA